MESIIAKSTFLDGTVHPLDIENYRDISGCDTKWSICQSRTADGTLV